MPNPINEEDIVKKYDLEIAKVSFFKNYLIIEVAEGVSFNHEMAKQLSRLTDLHFGDNDFGYISNRVNSYSLEPTDYLKIKEVFPNIRVFAVITYNYIQKMSIGVENIFYHDNIVTFDCIKDAVEWVKEKLT